MRRWKSIDDNRACEVGHSCASNCVGVLAGAQGALGNRPVLASYGIFCRVPVCCVEDLQDVEAQLRRLYGTEDGQLCQALLTTEFQDWKRRVSRELKDEPRASPRTFLTLVVEEQNPRQLLSTIEAFLPAQYHLLYACHSVDIDRIMPVRPSPRGEKRKHECRG